MSKPVKDMMIREYSDLLDGVENAVLVSVRGISANDNNRMRVGLGEKGIRVTVIRNNLARHAFKDQSLGEFAPLLKGPSALAYGAESVVDVARELVAWAKQIDRLALKGGLLEGNLFEGDAGVRALSKMPTREEALAQAVGIIASPGRNLVSAVKGPGSAIVSILKTIEEKLEKGEAISKVA